MILQTERITKGFSTPESRWARFGPYYAMFPFEFAFEVVKKYSQEGDHIIDPFAGRGSSIFAGGVLNRHSLGIEINPVGWLYGTVKLNPADKKLVLERLKEIYLKRKHFAHPIQKLPLFFKMCYCDEVLKFLLSARSHLDWKNDRVDSTIMSVLLVYLHGKTGQSLSNQMQMTRAMDASYSIEWWKKNNLIAPPEIDPLEFMVKRINWRYGKGKPNIFKSEILYGDSVKFLNNFSKRNHRQKKYSLLFTSPPYYAITNYHADQWLRLWLLGGDNVWKPTQEENKGRFTSKSDYRKLLDNVFGNCAELMKNKSIVYVRTDKREFTFTTTLEILKKHFPHHVVKQESKPFIKRTQTEIHGNSSSCSGEIDIIMTQEN